MAALSSFAAAASAAASIGGGLMASGGSAGGAAGRAAGVASQEKQQNWQATSPWWSQGQKSQDLIGQLLGLGHTFNNGMGNVDQDSSNWQGDQANAFARFKASPDYDFRMQEGINALDRSASSKGRLMSGAQNKATQQFGGNLASVEYNNWFNKLVNSSTMGLNATNSTMGVNAGLTGQQTNAMMREGDYFSQGQNAMANGIGGAANAFSSYAGYLDGRGRNVNPMAGTGGYGSDHRLGHY